MSDMGYNETIFEHDKGNDWFGVSTGEQKWKNRLKKLAEQCPDEVKCIVENDDGSVYYHVPDRFVVIRKPRHVELTDERRAELSAQLASVHRKNQPNLNASDSEG